MVDQAGRRDPYRVWISEILLQQTQVARGRVYFENFIEQFPDVQALAAAPTEAVLKAWEGCGYYARARNLHTAAKIMAATGMPDTYAGWLALPGVGPYTAAAISSLAYGEARAVNDGNVRRVLSRLFAEAQPSEKWVQARADALLDPQRPGDWNEALMDLGATICTPRTPNCPACPLAGSCAALNSGDPASYPAAKKRSPLKAVRAVALLIGDAQTAYLEQRAGALLGGLYGLPTEIEEGEAGEGRARQAADAPQRLLAPAARHGQPQHDPPPDHPGGLRRRGRSGARGRRVKAALAARPQSAGAPQRAGSAVLERVWVTSVALNKALNTAARFDPGRRL